MRFTLSALLPYFILLLSVNFVRSQDIHYSHIHASPIVLNPSLVGLYDGDIRLIGNFRQQWATVPVNYRTVGSSLETNLMDIGRNGFLSGGVQLHADKAGDLSFTITTANFSLAYAQPLDFFGDHYFSVGVQGGMVTHTVDYTAIRAFDFEPLAVGAPNNINYFDVSAGASWFYSDGEDRLIYFGGSLYHLTRPNVSMLGQSSFEGDRLYRRLVIHGGLETRLSDVLHLMPSFIFMDQGPHQEINTGTFLKFELENSKRRYQDKPHLSLGAWVRWQLELNREKYQGIDAVIFALRMDYKRMIYTFSYDINVSSLSVVSNYRGGPELSAIFLYEGEQRLKHKKRVRCPRF